MAISLAGVEHVRAQQAPVRVLTYTYLPPRGWRFHLAAIEQAAQLLGIRDPIALYCADYRSGTRWGGMHTWAGGEHRIGVARSSTPGEASATLWHELAHAFQSERFASPGEWGRAYRAAGGRKGPGYRANVYEQAAQSLEDRAHEHPLVVHPLAV